MLLESTDPQYLAPCPDSAEEVMCNEESGDGWFCTRWKNHRGDHAAHTPDGKQTARWEK